LCRALRNEAWEGLTDKGWDLPDERLVTGAYGTTHVFHWPGDGVPIVLIHGAQTDPLMWAPLIAELDPSRSIYAPNTPGDPGESVQTEAIADVEGLNEWLEETLDSLDLDRVHLVGCSYGGWVALHYAATRPPTIASLTLIEPVVDRIRPKFHVHGIGSGLAMSIPGPQRRPLGRHFDVEFMATNPNWRKLGAMAFMKHAGRPGLPKFTPIDDAVVAKVSVPTYAIFGARSPVHHAHDLAVRLSGLNPNIVTELVARAGHTLAVEQPATVAALIEWFYDEGGANSGDD